MRAAFLILLVGLALLLLPRLKDLDGPKRAKAARWLFMGVALVASLRFGLYWAALLVILLPALQGPVLALFRGALGRNPASEAPPAAGRARASDSARPRSMTREEALQVLGLEAGASRDQVLDSYRRLMKRLHPDTGGSDYLAAKINQAKDVLAS